MNVIRTDFAARPVKNRVSSPRILPHASVPMPVAPPRLSLAPSLPALSAPFAEPTSSFLFFSAARPRDRSKIRQWLLIIKLTK
jgi:hypothetical protein